MQDIPEGSCKCPRCGCLNTKFCYYNNYNLSQPRFYCKGCRRYWTLGGVLRNLPVGGRVRKAKQAKRSNQKRGDNGKSSYTTPTCEQISTGSHNSSSASSIPVANITTTLTTIETEPTTSFNQMLEQPSMFHQTSTDDHHIFSDTFGSLITSSSDELPPMTSLLMHQRDQDEVEDWSIFDQSYWLNNNNPDHQLSYFL